MIKQAIVTVPHGFADVNNKNDCNDGSDGGGDSWLRTGTVATT